MKAEIGARLRATVETPVKDKPTIPAGTEVTVVAVVQHATGEYQVETDDGIKFFAHIGDWISAYPFEVVRKHV